MRYKVTIETEEEVTATKQEWVQLFDSEVFKAKEAKWEVSTTYQELSHRERKEQGPEQYAWRDKEITSTQKVTVLEQTLDTVDIVAVIKALNGIS